MAEATANGKALVRVVVDAGTPETGRCGYPKRDTEQSQIRPVTKADPPLSTAYDAAAESNT